MKTNNLLNVISAVLILLFVYAASSKLLDFHAFQAQMHHQVFASWQADLLVWLVPAAELSVSLLLLAPRYRLTGFYFSAGLLVIFTVYIGLALLRVFSNMPCTCGGVISSLSWGQHLLFNLFFLLLSLIGISITNRERRLTGSY